MRKVIITSFYYYPENTPRAFRTYELVQEFIRRGYKVELFIPNYNQEYKYNSNLRIFTVDKKNVRSTQDVIPNNSIKYLLKKSSLCVKFYKIIKYLYYPIIDRYSKCLANEMENLKDEKYDLLISVGLPFSVHQGTAKFLKKHGNNIKTTVADYGDPFSFNPVRKIAPWYGIIEKCILNNFDYVSIPTINAKEGYLKLKSEDKIKVIPQGFNFDLVKVDTYVKNNIPTFSYGGIFYENIRNPKLLFEKLIKIDKDFRFIIYTNKSSKQLIQEYIKILGQKLIVKDLVSRERIIYEMSKMDFLLNLDNISEKQVPSKIIDYTLSGRPIFSMTPIVFDEFKFNQFLNGNYQGQLDINIEQYNIINVCQQFIALMEENKYGESQY